MAGYVWRKLNSKQREEVLNWRKTVLHPWHSPPHRPNYGRTQFLVSAACYEHAYHIGYSLERMDSFSATLLDVLKAYASRTVVWCVLPNHYHALVQTDNVLRLLYELGRFHGRTSFLWNKEEGTVGRQNFRGAVERYMRSERHFFATVNYVLNNPLYHKYVNLWPEWPLCSAT